MSEELTSEQSVHSFESEMNQKEFFTGEFLRQVREFRKISLDEIADKTRVGKNYLRAIEEEDLDVFPALVYLKGFLRQYSKYIGLNPEKVVAGYVKLRSFKKTY
ncbi:MAG: helix-turn-helix domain-containing protein [Deltaproteobacteria bacterium]|nr:helix-turn-helix domain-containing protein [Deltaproteobacteria bacterium]